MSPGRKDKIKQSMRKGLLYDSCAKVPFMISWPGHIPEGKRDKQTLVSGDFFNE